MSKRKTEKFGWGGLHPLFHNPFISYFTPLDLRKKIILDCGCGKGINAYLIRVTKDLSGSKLIGLDMNEEYLRFVKKHKVYDKTIKHKLPEIPLKDKSVDFVLCNEVIEHLPKSQGKKLLSEIDRVCKERAIVTTPNIFFLNEKDKYIDEHHSKWSAADFKSMGYKTYGVGIKIPIHYSSRFMKIKHILNYVLTPISFVLPDISEYLICTKDFNNT